MLVFAEELAGGADVGFTVHWNGTNICNVPEIRLRGVPSLYDIEPKSGCKQSGSATALRRALLAKLERGFLQEPPALDGMTESLMP